MATIHNINKNNLPEIMQIVRGLPEWFNEDARRNIPVDIRFHKAIGYYRGKELIGFLTYFVYEAVAIIGWLGVSKEHHGHGSGTALISELEIFCEKNGIGAIQVYTLSDIVEYEPYDKTRSFYYKNGFSEFRRIRTGNPECPEELHLRKEIKMAKR